ncbi:MAG: MFS transporter [Phycisphaerae bacterium]|nr:MFS transporter [Phycisphaerae bacterium]
MPKVMPSILLSEACERYAYYSLMAILAVFLKNHLMTGSGDPANLTETQVTKYTNMFQTVCYFTPVLGALISDMFWGKFKTIMIFATVFCVGFLAMTLDQSYLGIICGLALIATGTGIIKPCLSANVGDQFGSANQHLISKAYDLFYWSVNIGATFSMFLAPIVLAKFGPKWAFGTSGGAMVLATVTYWMMRKKLAHIPPKGTGFVKETLSREGLMVIVRLFFFLYIFVAVFWSLFNQTMSKWVLQAQKMNLTFFNWSFSQDTFLGKLLSVVHLDTVTWDILPEQIQAVNSLLVVMAIPIFTFVIYPLINRVFPLTPLRKVALGFFVAIPSFAIPAWLEGRIASGDMPSCWWQVLAYVFITAGEVMISIPALEFSYTQAPKKMKSFIGSLNLLSISLGSLFVVILSQFIENPDGTSKLGGPAYYWFFTGLLAATGVIFCIAIQFYKGKTYIQGEED